MSRRPSYLTIGILALSAVSAAAQAPPIKAQVVNLNVETIKSPDFEVGSGIKDIKGKRNDWIQIDVEFQTAGGDRREDFVGAVEIRYFVLPASALPDYKKLYAATIKHVDVLKLENLHSAVYLSPNALARMYGKGKSVNPRDLWVAVEIHIGGQLAGFKITDSQDSKWWRRTDVPKDTEMLRPKHKTPFAPLWYDAFAEVRE